ncbi:MAG: hypothetical protein OEU09_09110 [Rhodospirillales bacterium]|nr:hypothetical protein [Rhodospirillales bacterium]MDH3790175.1 hypothetical protein [Rhodospirillales bacterium]MDH3911443.1 hypothetical protein [Rhodospirillales bacterium]MDH3916971.1 hypothetical protein [Rhodospirillales bacterium]MDH3965870.1 hypothetical protein [Rhodospirillales bacterium]
MGAMILSELRQPVAASVRAAAQEVRRRHGASLVACLFYGSCLRDGRDEDRVIDFYAIADDYRHFYDSRLSAVLNAILPPNVYYLETNFGDRVVRAKYAVVSLGQLIRRTSPAAFQPSLWGRLAQPCALVYARDSVVEETVAGALAAAAKTMAAETLALMPAEFTPDQLWIRAFRESYGTELRAERSNRPQDLYCAYSERYDGLTAAALSGSECLAAAGAPAIRHRASAGKRRAARLRWMIRRLLGKTTHVLRLLKAAYTFKDGLDYILWKIEKHSGVHTTPTPWQRRHPLMAAPSLAWRLYRRGAFR